MYLRVFVSVVKFPYDISVAENTSLVCNTVSDSRVNSFICKISEKNIYEDIN
jgi:hypothetical protein